MSSDSIRHFRSRMLARCRAIKCSLDANGLPVVIRELGLYMMPLVGVGNTPDAAASRSVRYRQQRSLGFQSLYPGGASRGDE